MFAGLIWEMKNVLGVHFRVAVKAMPYKLGRSAGHTLMILRDCGEISQREIARKLQITPATVTAMLSRMQRDGFIQRREDPSDARAMRVSLTPKGDKAALSSLNTLGHIDRQCTEALTPEEQKALQEMCKKMIKKLEELEEEYNDKAF